MLRFSVTQNGAAVDKLDLAGAYLIGSDGVPLRAEFEFNNSQIVCAKRAEGPAALALVWPVSGCGTLVLETSRLMERDKPYILPLELARGRLMRISLKREEWGLYDFEEAEPLGVDIDKSRDILVEAIKADTQPEQIKLGDESLRLAIEAAEKLSHFHADIFLARRKQIHAFTRRTFGCSVDLTNTAEAYRKALVDAFDFVNLPIPWRAIEPKQGEFNWRPFDAWIEWLAKSRVPMRVGPLVNFQQAALPAWLGSVKVDFETIGKLIAEHVKRIVERYGNYVFQWNVISGVHADNTFDFTFEQLMELTRMTVLQVKQLAPRAQTIIELTSPWGEYYARNQKTIPPVMYADMVVQGGVGFDGLGAQFVFGQPTDGEFMRDMFQISDKLDRLGNLGKQVHVTAVQVPSLPVTNGTTNGGFWRKPWDEATQAEWAKEFYTTALSKPFVESVTWLDLADRKAPAGSPSSGLLRADLAVKPSYKAVKDFRAEILGTLRKPPAARSNT